MDMKDMDISRIPEVVAVKKENLTPVEKRLETLKGKIMAMVEDATEVVHSAIKGEPYKGVKVSRTQLFAASPVVSKFGPEIDKISSGQVHLHLNIPRPQPDTHRDDIDDIEGKTMVEGKIVGSIDKL